MRYIILITITFLINSTINSQELFFSNDVIKEKKIKEISVYYQSVRFYDDTVLVRYDKNEKVYNRRYNKDYLMEYEIYYGDFESYYYWSRNNDTAFVKRINLKMRNSYNIRQGFNIDTFYIDNKYREIISFNNSYNTETHYIYNEDCDSVRIEFYDTKNKELLIKKEIYYDEEKDSILLIEHRVKNIYNPWKIQYKRTEKNTINFTYEKNTYGVRISVGNVYSFDFMSNKKELLERYSYHNIAQDLNKGITYENYFYEYLYRD